MRLAAMTQAQPVPWTILSNSKGDLPSSGGSHQQTGLLAAKLNPKSKASDLVISFRVKAPALVDYRGATKAGVARGGISQDPRPERSYLERQVPLSLEFQKKVR
jgi:hypothetical protein